MPSFDRLVERQIQKARIEGKLDALEGEGRPLPDRTGDAFVDPGDAAGFRIMAQAGILPEEIEIRKRMDALRAELKVEEHATSRRALMRRLADLELRYNIAREARRRFLAP